MSPIGPARPGDPWTLGATRVDGGVNVAVFSEVAEGMTLCLFDEAGDESQIPLTEYDAGVWHGFVPGVPPGTRYGFRAAGPYAPERGVRCNPAKLLLDPYARAIVGEVRYAPELHDAHAGDSAPLVPRGVVVDTDPTVAPRSCRGGAGRTPTR